MMVCLEAKNVEETLKYAWLSEGNGAVWILIKTGTKVILQLTFICKVKIFLKGFDFRLDDFFVRRDNAGIININNEYIILFGEEAFVNGRLLPSTSF